MAVRVRSTAVRVRCSRKLKRQMRNVGVQKSSKEQERTVNVLPFGGPTTEEQTR